MDINELQSLYHVPNVSNPCYVVNITAEHGIWQSENPLTQALPLLAMQLSLVILVTRGVYYILRPFRVPRIVADILGGILIGPTALGKHRFFRNLFPLRSILIVETVAYWALACHMFLVGLEMDMYAVLRASKRVIHVAVAGVVIPFIMGIGLFFLMTSGDKDYNPKGCFFWAVSLAVTGYPIVTRVLADLKLQHIEVGRTAMSTALVSDFIAWILVTILIPARINALTTAVAVFCTAGFALVCVLWVRPALKWIIRKTSGENNTYSEHHLCFVLVSISLFAVVTELIGTNSIVGAFIFGIIMPDRMLANAFLEKFEDFMSGYFLPLFFTVCGIKINIWSTNGNWILALVVIVFACSAKILSTFAAAYFYQMPRRETVSLGVVLNTKGVLAIVVLNMGIDKKILRSQDYSVMAIAILLMTIAVGPIIGSVYRASKRLSHYKRRTIQKATPDSELRILACFQTFRNVSGMISLIDSSNANKKSPLAVFALHLVELTGRASAMLIVHSTGKSSGSSHRGHRNSHSEKIIGALETYETLNDNVTINALTSLSPFATMHEDICSLAEDKHVACLIIPFHKLPSKDGKLEDEENHTSFRGVNLNVLANAPCSVGIFVDKGFGSAAANGGDSRLTMRQIAMLFIGGPDDREALAYAWRMVGTDGISLTVFRFLPGDQVEEIEPLDLPGIEQHKILTTVSYVDRNRRLDDEYVNEFRLKVAGEQFISYEEKIVNNDEEIVLALREMHHMYDLYVVGKGEGIVSPLTAGLADWCEYPELGPMGDLLVTSSFAQGSVLVMQHYTGARDGNFDMMSADSSGHGSERFGNWRNSAEEDDFGGLDEAPFANHNTRNGVGAT